MNTVNSILRVASHVTLYSHSIKVLIMVKRVMNETWADLISRSIKLIVLFMTVVVVQFRFFRILTRFANEKLSSVLTVANLQSFGSNMPQGDLFQSFNFTSRPADPFLAQHFKFSQVSYQLFRCSITTSTDMFAHFLLSRNTRSSFTFFFLLFNEIRDELSVAKTILTIFSRLTEVWKIHPKEKLSIVLLLITI